MNRCYNNFMKKKQDARKVSQKELAEKRWKIIELRGEGISNIETAKAVGMKPQTVSTLYNRCLREGEDIIELKKRGRPKYKFRKLSEEVEKKILQLLINSTPLDLGYDTKLWTRELVQVLIQKEMNIEIPKSTLGDYLKNWDITIKKPIKSLKNLENTTDHIFSLKQEFNEIEREAKKNDGDILWIDKKQATQKTKLIYAILQSKKMMFVLYPNTNTNSEVLIDFLKRIIESSDRKIYLILNKKSKLFLSKDLQKWIHAHSDKIVISIMEHL